MKMAKIPDTNENEKSMNEIDNYELNKIGSVRDSIISQ
jgi:hypothetical protein